MNLVRIVPSSMITLVIAVVVCAMTQGCDRALILQFENRTNETILVVSRYDDEDSFSPSVRLPPHTVKEVPFMILATGVQLRGVSLSSDKVVLDRHIIWDERKPGDRVIVIDEMSNMPSVTPIKERN